MKPIYRIIIASAILALAAACTKEDNNLAKQAGDGTSVTFTAGFPEVEPESRMSFNAGKLGWEAGDAIAVCDGASVISVTLTSADILESGAKAKFKADGLDASAAAYYAVYPASVAGTDAASFLSGTNIKLHNAGKVQDTKNSLWCVATTTGTSLSFKNVGAVIVIEPDAAKNISYMILNSECNEVLASDPVVDPADGSFTAGSATSSQIRSNVTDGKAYFCIEAKKLSAGFVIRCYDSADSYLGYFNRIAAITPAAKKYYPVTSFNTAFVAKETSLPEFVDLGLPSGNLWAKCNMGADTPTGVGNWYSYGECYTKDYFGLTDASKAQNYRFGKTASKLVKYRGVAGKPAMDVFDDPVTMLFGEPCCVPTDDDFAELVSDDNTYKEYVTEYAGATTTGYIFYKKKAAGEYTEEDPHIFMPICGYKNQAAVTGTSKAYYMSSNCETTAAATPALKVITAQFTSAAAPKASIQSTPYFGLSVRPVKKP